jgi:acyl-CoA thioesterase FadM
MSINNYDELYSEFLHIIAEVHNAHLHYKRKSTIESRVRIRKALSKVKEQAITIRMKIQEIQEEKEKNNE